MKKIIVDNSLFQTRIVLVHDGEPVEMFYESRKGKSIVGNIYAGRVENCIKGMQACFVDIGIGKNGYLPLKSDSSIKNGDEQEEYIFKTLRESGSLAERPLGNT